VTYVWLGRPWRPLASVVFLSTEMGAHVEPAGWREWHPGETDYMKTVFYAEHDSTGPGAHPAERDPRTKKLTAAEAARYAPRRVLAGKDGWNPIAPRPDPLPAQRAEGTKKGGSSKRMGSQPDAAVDGADLHVQPSP
jgi:hypothetical protein